MPPAEAEHCSTCSHCGKSLTRDANFCARCGKERDGGADRRNSGSPRPSRYRSFASDVVDKKSSQSSSSPCHRRHVKGRVESSDAGEVEKLLAENTELSDRVFELERLNEDLTQSIEDLEEQLGNLPVSRRTTRKRTRTRNATGAWFANVDDEDGEDWIARKAKLLWHKGVQAVMLENAGQIRRKLHWRLIESQAQCQKLHGRIDEVERSLTESHKMNDAQRLLIDKEKKAIQEMSASHAVERDNLCREKQSLEEELSMMTSNKFAEGHGRKTVANRRLVTCNLMSQLVVNPEDEEDDESGESQSGKMADQHAELQTLLEESTLQLTDALSAKEDVEKQLDDLQNRMFDLKKKFDEKARSEKQLGGQNADLHEHLASCSRLLGEALAANRDITKQHDHSARLALEFENKLDEKAQQEIALKSQRSELESQLVECGAQRGEALAAKNSLANHRDDLELQIADLEEKLRGKEEQVHERDQQQAGLQDQLAKRGKQLAEALLAREGLTQQVDDLKCSSRGLREQLDAELHEKTQAREELQHHRQCDESSNVVREAEVARKEVKVCEPDRQLDTANHPGELWNEVQLLRHQLALSHKREEQWRAAVGMPWWRRWQDFCCSSDRTHNNEHSPEEAPLIKMDSTGGMPSSFPSPGE